MEKLNKKIAEIKETVTDITKPFFYTERQINLLTLVYLSMILLDDEIEDLVMETLKKVYICISNDSVLSNYQRIKKQANISLLEKIIGWKAGYFCFRTPENQQETFFIIVEDHGNLDDLLESLIHEIKHAINEIIPSFFIWKEKAYFYSGLALVSDKETINESIDEAFNSFISKVYLNILYTLKNQNIEDPSIRKILEKLKKPQKYIFDHFLTKRYVQMFRSKYLFRHFYYACLYKDFEPLNKAIKKVFDKQYDAYEFFDDLDHFNDEIYQEHLNAINLSLIRKPQKIIPYIKNSEHKN